MIGLESVIFTWVKPTPLHLHLLLLTKPLNDYYFALRAINDTLKAIEPIGFIGVKSQCAYQSIIYYCTNEEDCEYWRRRTVTQADDCHSDYDWYYVATTGEHDD